MQIQSIRKLFDSLVALMARYMLVEVWGFQPQYVGRVWLEEF